ncbi:diphosphomevalonate decarboxylase [Ascosphaera atra]|nr:diphosphomevalonate decarboxylase [Ascosphaera atra]
MRALILVVSDAKKDTPSTEGMQSTVATSPLFATRAKTVVPERMAAMEQAIAKRDFASFAEITMKESNDFHATCLDTWPPIFYMNDTSRAAVRLVHQINNVLGEQVCAYTFDAGPNAVIYFLEKNEERILGTFQAILTHAEGWNNASPKASDILNKLDARSIDTLKEGVSRVIVTRVGDGPKKVDQHLISADSDK